MTPHYDEQTENGLVKAETSPWTEPFQRTYTNTANSQPNVWSDAAMQTADAKRAAEEPMQANQHMDDQTRNALSKIFYGS